LNDQAQIKKLATEGASSCFLKKRTKYLCLVADLDLQLQLFTLNRDGKPSNVTTDYSNDDDTVCFEVEENKGYTLCNIELKTKAQPLIMAQRSQAHALLRLILRPHGPSTYYVSRFNATNVSPMVILVSN
jgi:hypothetical protein